MLAVGALTAACIRTALAVREVVRLSIPAAGPHRRAHPPAQPPGVLRVAEAAEAAASAAQSSQAPR